MADVTVTCPACDGTGDGREDEYAESYDCLRCGGSGSTGTAPRVLVTGSRHWTDRGVIYRALLGAWDRLGRDPRAVLVHGACHLGGADIIAEEIWDSWGLWIERHPAEMGPDGHVLGSARNAEMVELGANVCLAFPLPQSRGTRNCIRLAREAGIPVEVYTVTGTRPEALAHETSSSAKTRHT